MPARIAGFGQVESIQTQLGSELVHHVRVLEEPPVKIGAKQILTAQRSDRVRKPCDDPGPGGWPQLADDPRRQLSVCDQDQIWLKILGGSHERSMPANFEGGQGLAQILGENRTGITQVPPEASRIDGDDL